MKMNKDKILKLCDEIENTLSDAWNSNEIEYELAGRIVSFAKKIAAEITAPPKSNADRIRQVSPLDRLAAEYDRKHPNGLKFTYSLDGETQQTTAKSGSRLVFTERLKLTLKINDYIAEHGIIVDTSGLDVITAISNLGLLNEEACKKYLEW